MGQRRDILEAKGADLVTTRVTQFWTKNVLLFLSARPKRENYSKLVRFKRCEPRSLQDDVPTDAQDVSYIGETRPEYVRDVGSNSKAKTDYLFDPTNPF
jgi:hypothetical protein